MTFTQCICSFVDLREYGEERTWFLEKLKMMTILILRSFYYSGLSLGFFLCFCFFCFIPLPLVPKVKGQQRWRLVAVGFFLLLFVCSSVTVSLCCPVLLHVSLCFFLFSLSSSSPSLSRLSPWRWNLLLAAANEDDSVEGLFQHCFLSSVFFCTLSFLSSLCLPIFLSASLFLLLILFPPLSRLGSSFSPAFIGQRRPCAGNGQLDFNAFNDKTSPIFLLLETVDEEEGNEQLSMKRLCFKWLFWDVKWPFSVWSLKFWTFVIKSLDKL